MSLKKWNVVKHRKLWSRLEIRLNAFRWSTLSKNNSLNFNHTNSYFVWTMRFVWTKALNKFQNVILRKWDKCKKLICLDNKTNWNVAAILHCTTFLLTFLYLLLTSSSVLFNSVKNNVWKASKKTLKRFFHSFMYYVFHLLTLLHINDIDKI